MPELYLIRATDERDDDSPLWWSNEGGWSELGEALVYTPAEAALLNLPLGGEWVKFTTEPDHVAATGCNLDRADFLPGDPPCADGGTVDEHPDKQRTSL